MSKQFMYVGPTIIGVVSRNSVYEKMPEPLGRAIKAAPYLAGLCIPISRLSQAMVQIRNRQGNIYVLYNRALKNSAEIQKGANA